MAEEEDHVSEQPLPPLTRLCWWRDPELEPYRAFQEPQFFDPKDTYNYERAMAESVFRSKYDEWESCERAHPSNETCHGHETNIRALWWVINGLEMCIGEFLNHALCAYGDFLLNRKLAATEGIEEFDKHAKELLQKTYEYKWLFGLRRVEISDEEIRSRERCLGDKPEETLGTERFWGRFRESVAEVRNDFELLLWKSELSRDPHNSEKATASDDSIDTAMAERGRLRSDWLDLKLIAQGGWSDVDLANHGGPAYNTIQSWRSGYTSTRIMYVRHKIAKALKCDVATLPV